MFVAGLPVGLAVERLLLSYAVGPALASLHSMPAVELAVAFAAPGTLVADHSIDFAGPVPLHCPACCSGVLKCLCPVW